MRRWSARPRESSRPRPRFHATPLIVCLLALVGCDGSADPGAGTQVVPEEPPASPPDRSELGAALAFARAVELPEELVTVDFHQPDAVFEAAAALSFTETLSATVVDAMGEPTFWLDLTIVHQASPRAYHASGDVGGTEGVWGMMAELQETLGDTTVDLGGGLLPDTIGVIRIGDDYWTLGSAGWSGPETVDYVTLLGRTTPARSLSAKVQPITWSPDLTPQAHQEMEGRTVAHYRLDDDPVHMRDVWSALLPDLPIESLPGDARGTLDLWLYESGLLARARLAAEDAQGRGFTVRFDLRGFDEPVDISPPPGGS